MFGLKIIKQKDLQDLKETMTEYKRTLEDIGWINMSENNSNAENLLGGNFETMIKRVKLFYYNNPLAGHWVQLTTSFVFGEGISIPKAKEPKIQEIIDSFWENKDNKKVLTGFVSQQLLCNKLQYEGNLFFLLYDNDAGDVVVRILDTLEIADIINQAEDRNRPNFYKVKVCRKEYNYSSDSWELSDISYKYFPDIDNWNYETFGVPLNKLGDARVYHVKINCDINDKFGVPELYRGLDWIKAHKTMSEDLATLIKSLSKWAWEKKVKGSPAQVRSIAGNLSAKTDLSSIQNTVGRTHVSNQGLDLKSVDVNTGGVNITIDGMRQMKLMVCAASGLFEHYYGDPSTGNLATAKTMEAPMVRKFAIYQSLWRSIFEDILQYQIDKKISVGSLSGTEIIDLKTNRVSYETPLDRTLDIDFPPIIEEDLESMARALGTAKDKGLIGKELAAQLFMLAANVNNIDEEIEKVLAEIEERKKEQQEQFAQVNSAKQLTQFPSGKKIADKVSNAKVKETNIDEELEEAIETPNKNTGRTKDRIERKNNFLSQKLNGYRKRLAGEFRTLEQTIKENTKTMTQDYNGDKVTTGDIENLHLHVREFIDGMKQAAREYFPQAVEIGEKYVQVEAKDAGIDLQENIFESKGKATGVLEDRIDWNDRYLDQSLYDDMVNDIHETMIQPFSSEKEYKTAISKAVKKFESRVELYAGAFWTVEEHSVKEAAKGLDMIAVYAGPLDELNCEGCRDAVLNNPYTPESVPVPGSFQSGMRCRHAIQLKKKEEL